MTSKPILNSTPIPYRAPRPEPPRETARLSPGKYAILGIVTLTGAFGDTLLSIGMKHFGPVPLARPELMIRALYSPWVAGGVLLLLAFFASYLTALSWADLTYVLPATSFGYAVIALLSKLWLHERISPGRWMGIALIVAGVGFVARGPALTTNSEPPLTGTVPGTLQGAEEG